MIFPSQFCLHPERSLHLRRNISGQKAFGVHKVLEHATVPSSFRARHLILFSKNLKKNNPNLKLRNPKHLPKVPTPTAIFLESRDSAALLFLTLAKPPLSAACHILIPTCPHTSSTVSLFSSLSTTSVFSIL